VVGGWRLAVGGWRLAVGCWRLAVGGWRLAVVVGCWWMLALSSGIILLPLEQRESVQEFETSGGYKPASKMKECF
jgi:hypothetical protein